MYVLAEAVSLVVAPLTFIDLSLRVSECAMAPSSSKLPLTDIASSIMPSHGASPMAEAALPLALVNRSCRFINILFLNDWCILVIGLL